MATSINGPYKVHPGCLTAGIQVSTGFNMPRTRFYCKCVRPRRECPLEGVCRNDLLKKTDENKPKWNTKLCTDIRGEESQTLEEPSRSSSGKRSIKTTERNDPDPDTAVQYSLETIGCPSASNRFASLQTEEDTHEVDELGSNSSFDYDLMVSGSDSEKDDMRLVPTLRLVVLKLSRTSFGLSIPSFTKGLKLI
ncbi:hypothetical protein SLEP1_g58587 [Rubroshorea leprosula]|uniref:Uncharacterized protein n=1 Tax=Rubroshorea leprosula TaxID=152421 RepID=A0AAV5MPV3_9ROSI|nr:hypothetical protein SLEP1_g58587 [Rubroshorea leprosula]